VRRASAQSPGCRYGELVANALPFVWINNDAEGALSLYERLFDGAEVVDVDRDPRDGNTLMSATLRVGGTDVIIFNGEPHAQMPVSSLVSIMLLCENQDEVDRYWEGLADGGEPGRCGWITDRFTVTWQIVPRLFRELTTSGDDAARVRVFDAMMKMDKFDCGQLQAAFDAS
jgi:predicted 3-demethylubiquinone-9 3-methyltransferase (glyoxalase superfamily)